MQIWARTSAGADLCHLLTNEYKWVVTEDHNVRLTADRALCLSKLTNRRAVAIQLDRHELAELARQYQQFVKEDADECARKMNLSESHRRREQLYQQFREYWQLPEAEAAELVGPPAREFSTPSLPSNVIPFRRRAT